MTRGAAIGVAMVAATLATAALAATTPLRLEEALTLRTFSSPVWSADGSRLAFVVTLEDTAENTRNGDLWMWDARRNQLSQLTRHPKSDGSPTFSPSGDTVAFVANRGTGDNARSTIWMLSLHGGEPWTHSSFDEGIGEVQWSPDGRWLAYVQSDTLPKRIRDWRSKKWDHVVEDERLQFPHLWVIDLVSGRRRQLTTGEQFVWYVRWSPDSRRIAYLVSPTGKPDDGNQVDIGVATPDGASPRRLGALGGAFAWSPDSRWIAWAGGTRRDEWVQKDDVWVVPATGGAAVNLTGAFDEDGQTPCWNATSDTVFFHAEQGVTTRLAAVALPRAGTAPTVILGEDRGGAAAAPTAATAGRCVWVRSAADRPEELYVADHPRLPGRAITSFNASVATRALATTREFTWTSDDGTQVGGVLLRPHGARSNTRLKTLVWLHGGPYGDRADLGFQPWGQYLASRGYQVFMPNFRSSGGSGTAFMVRERADWGGQDFRDVQTGIDSLIRAGLADGDRLGVYGRSYGGYLTSWAITQTDRFDAAVAIAPIADLAALYGQSDVQKYRAYEFRGKPWETHEFWQRSSPITHIARAKTPTLVVGFDEDRRTPVAQAYQLYRGLLGVGVPTEFVHYPREPHVPREYRHRADQHLRMAAWFDRWVK